MPFNGSGTYSLPSNSFNPAVATTTIDPNAWNGTATDFATAFSTCLLKDGTQTATASIPFAAGISTDTIAPIGATGVTIAGVNLKTGNIILTDSSDTTKKATFAMSGITTATTRTYTFPDASGTLTALGNASTGSGSVVLATSPTLVTPILGVAAATSINKMAITAPATSSTLAVADGKTFTASNTITLAATNDSQTYTLPAASANLGYLNIPQNSQSAAYTTVLADSGKCIYHPAGDTNARTFTIDSNANVAYPIGTCITFQNATVQVVTIAITTDTMTLAGTTTTGSRSLAQNGIATAIKNTSTTWIINGSGIT